MKKITLSLTAIALIVTAAQADIQSKKFGGSASLYYGTNDAKNGDLFDKGTSYGNAAVQLGGSAAVGACDTCVTLNYGVTGVSTLGLENTLVSNTWVGQSVGPKVGAINDGIWIDTLNLAFMPLSGVSNTTMVVGRQALDTPIVFSETWSIAKNTFDAAVAVNNDIVDTTLVAAWVGRSNGYDLVDRIAKVNTPALGLAATVDSDGISNNAFHRFLTNEGAYAVGAVTKAIPGVAAQAWYYIVPSTAQVGWLQADGSYEGFGLGAQYVYTDAKDAGFADTGSAYAVKIGYNYEGLGLSAAYSSVDEYSLVANVAGSQSKLYTEAWWNYGQIGLIGDETDTVNVTAKYDMKDVANFGVYYTAADHKTAADLTEIAVTAGTKLGNLDATLAYINTDIDGADAVNEVQAYLTYNF